MDINNLEEIFYTDSSAELLTEILLRSFVMFGLILIFLRISGRRGVKQLTLFEVAIILGLGSAAGDPMFQDDIPIVHAIAVFLAVIVFYRGITWLSSKFGMVQRFMEGEPITIVRDGEFTVKENKMSNFSQMEFFSELRNESIEHLGQVRIAILETDGSLSLLRYPKDQIRFGLPLFPDDYKQIDDQARGDGPFACMFCGRVIDPCRLKFPCAKCGENRWAQAKKALGS